MVRRKALSRYKHLLESDTARKTEPVGTKKPGEAGIDDIPQGVEALEAALNEERMAAANPVTPPVHLLQGCSAILVCKKKSKD